MAEVVRRCAEERFGAVALAEPPSSIGAGFDSYIHLVRPGRDRLPDAWRRPLVVRLLPSVDRVEQAHREADGPGVEWRSRGYPAPLVLEVLAPDGVRAARPR